jgi:hypothetical protein
MVSCEHLLSKQVTVFFTIINLVFTTVYTFFKYKMIHTITIINAINDIETLIKMVNVK